MKRIITIFICLYIVSWTNGQTPTITTIKADTANINSSITLSPTLYGGTGASGNLTLISTTNATKGHVYVGSTTLFDADVNTGFVNFGGGIKVGSGSTNSTSEFTNNNTTTGSSIFKFTNSAGTLIGQIASYNASNGGTIDGVTVNDRIAMYGDGGAFVYTNNQPIFLAPAIAASAPTLTATGAKIGINNISPDSTLNVTGSMHVTSNSNIDGNLGIATSSLQTILTAAGLNGIAIKDAGGKSPGISLQNGSNGFEIFSNTGGELIGVNTNTSVQAFRVSTANVSLPGLYIGSPSSAPTAVLQLKAGTATASTAPLKFTASGAVVLGTPEQGVAETDANGLLYYTPETTAGRGYVPDVQRFRLTADGGTISTIANFFGTTSNPTLVSGAEYIIEIDCYYTNTTSGTVTWTFTNSAAPTSQNIHARFSPLTGIVAPAGSAVAYIEGDVQGNATAAEALTTSGTLTNATTQWAHFSIHLYNATGTSLKIQATKLVGGTITPLKGSYWTCTRVPAGNIGTFAN